MSWEFYDQYGSLKSTDPTGKGVIYSDTAPLRKDVIWVDTGTSGLIPVVTSLPGNPYDGQTVVYRPVADVAWTFMYNGAGGTYKWEFIGGGTVRAGTATGVSQGNSGGVMVAPSTQLSIAIPFAGVYEVEIGSGMAYCSVVGVGGAIGFSGPGFATGFNSENVARADGNTAQGVSTTVTVTATASGNLVSLTGTGGATTLTLPYGYHMTMKPIRVG